jgi:hypothetical protein
MRARTGGRREEMLQRDVAGARAYMFVLGCRAVASPAPHFAHRAPTDRARPFVAVLLYMSAVRQRALELSHEL